MSNNSTITTMTERNTSINGGTMQTNNNEPFKATKIWNEVLQAFYLGIKLDKHRYNMKTYYECFTASEAVSWLKNYLRQCGHFDNIKVTRFQALNLLRKYHKSNIIERVQAKRNHKELQDNGELFWFNVNTNENLPFFDSTRSDADLTECIGTNKVQLNLNEKIEAHKKAIWIRMQAIEPDLVQYIKYDKLLGRSIYDNITRVNVNGVVQLADKNEDLPPWVLSAMKCLANWPQASGTGNCLPKYPGFETDVFKLIKEYFVNSEEPIVPFEFYPLVMHTYNSYLQKMESYDSTKLSSFVSYNSCDVLRPHNRVQTSKEVNLPSNCVYETVFSDKEPVTKIVPLDELSGILPSIVDYFNKNASPSNRPLTTLHTTTIPRSASRKNAQSLASITNNQLNSTTDKSIATDSHTLSRAFRFSSLRKNVEKSSKVNDCITKPSLGPQEHYQLLQMVLLLLPSAKRRQLQLLVRLFHKIICNKELCLLTDDSIALKDHIVDTFSSCVVRCANEMEYNELLAKKFLSFLVDECINLFKVPSPLLQTIEQQLDNIETKKSRSVSTFCEQISSEEFEMQRDVLSETALSELLESIMRDESMSERDKLKWIKQFKMYHPEVYDIYFANCTTVQTKIKSTQVNKRQYSFGTSLLPDRQMIKRFLSLQL